MVHTRNVALTEAGVTYQATVDTSRDEPRLTRLVIVASGTEDLVGAPLLPLSVVVARALAMPDPSGAKPTNEQLAAAYGDAVRARKSRRPGEAPVSIREELARRFDVPVARVDSWLKRLRAANPDALPRPYPGRPSKPSAPEETR